MAVRIDPANAMVASRPSAPPTARTPTRITDLVALKDSTALQVALAETPELRPEEVERAQRLVGDVRWPPDEITRRIAELLAIQGDDLAH